MGFACSTNVDERNAYSILVGKPEGIGCGGMDLIDLAQERKH
jgi:hypothetical protein